MLVAIIAGTTIENSPVISATISITAIGAFATPPNIAIIPTMTNGAGVSGIHATCVSDWTLNAGKSQPSFGNQIAASTTYRNCARCASGRDSVATDVFSAAIPVDPAKTLAGVTLPSHVTKGQLHVFALGTSTTPMSGAVITSVSPTTAAAGQVVTVTGTGFGASQGSGYVAFSDLGTSWGAPGNSAAFTVNSWSDTEITFTVPTPSGTGGRFRVWPGTTSSVMVVNSSAEVSDIGAVQVTPTSAMSDYYDNTGTSPDSNEACANIDGVGYSLSADALATAGVTPGGTVTSDGVTFTWPNAAACQPDNVLAAGQQILLPQHAGAGKVGFLVTSTNGDSSGPVTITYTDGSSTTATLDVSDWASGPTGTENTAASMPYRNSTGGTSQQLTVAVFEISVPVDSAKTVASVTLPYVGYQVGSGQTGMHIFAIGTN